MKQIALGVLIALCLAIPACQCSSKPDIGPVETAVVQVDLTLRVA